MNNLKEEISEKLFGILNGIVIISKVPLKKKLVITNYFIYKPV